MNTISIWPSIILLVAMAVTLGRDIALHGKGEDAWVTAIALATTITVLWWGGFFDKLLDQ